MPNGSSSADVLGVKKAVNQLKRVNANYPKRQMSLHGVRSHVPVFYPKLCTVAVISPSSLKYTKLSFIMIAIIIIIII